MGAGEPALLQLLELGLAGIFREFPDGGGEGRAPLVEGQSLIRAAEVAWDLGVDEGIGFGGTGVLEPGKWWDDEGWYSE